MLQIITKRRFSYFDAALFWLTASFALNEKILLAVILLILGCFVSVVLEGIAARQMGEP